MSIEKVLVIDDNRRWLDFFKRILEAEGYAVTLAPDYATAIQELKRTFYPVVVVDVHLLGHHDSQGLHLIEEMDDLWYGETIAKIIVSGWAVKPDDLDKITQKTKAHSVSFFPKGGTTGRGFDSLRFLATVGQFFYRLRRPVRCMFSLEECRKDVEPHVDHVFVAMPFSVKGPGSIMNMDDVFDQGIAPALRHVGYKAIRADKMPFAGGLMCNICTGIQGAVMCIADITNINPNVLLELGLMYGWGKTTVVLKHTNSEIPSDLKFALYVEYDGLPSLKSGLKKMILGLKQKPTARS